MNTDITQYQFVTNLKELDFVEQLWVFGSRSRGDNQPRSDIDIAIICPNATEEDWLQVMKIIDEADTLLKIDCVRFEQDRISHELYENILKDKKVIYDKNTN